MSLERRVLWQRVLPAMKGPGMAQNCAVSGFLRSGKSHRHCIKELNLLDPASGSGNFLTETYLSLRRLENEIIKERIGLEKGQISGQMVLGQAVNPIQVSIEQFYGIEINDFAVTVAKTALWIAESQMMKETEDIILMDLDFLPLTTNANIIEANALRIDWNDVVPAGKLNYIMGNPPFVAKTGRTSMSAKSSKGFMSDTQREDKKEIFGKDGGLLDYVCCWYKKAAVYIKNTTIHVAFVSTDSICQGQQVSILWKSLFKEGTKIDFAYRSFKWNSEATNGATVFVVIIGFSYVSVPIHRIYENGIGKTVHKISPYLFEGDNILIDKRSTPICNVPKIGIGNKPIDHGNYLFLKDEMKAFIKKEPKSKSYFKRWYGAEEFINSKERYCLWLGDCSPNELKQMPECMKRVKAVREYRLSSSSAGTRKIADKPTRFHVENMPKTNYIAIPEVSSGNRRYIPMSIMAPDVLCGNTMRLIPNATLYHFGILQSNVHMAWMRIVCGYFGPSYRYSVNIVYNNFPWPNPTPEQKVAIEKAAQGILDARALYPDSSLADLYDPLTMPPELRKAHTANDIAVMKAYGFSTKMTESECVAELMKMYQKLTECDRVG